jgi:hypothetical protein
MSLETRPGTESLSILVLLLIIVTRGSDQRSVTHPLTRDKRWIAADETGAWTST